MNPNDYNQNPNQPARPNQPMSSGRDWQAEAVYAATHPGYDPQAGQLRPVPGSGPTGPLPNELPNMPGTGNESDVPLPAPQAPQSSQQSPPPPPYTPPVDTSARGQQPPNYTPYSSMKKRRWPKILFAFLILALLAGVGYTGYQTFFAKKQATTNQPTNPAPAPAPTPDAKPKDPVNVNTLNAVVLNVPADIAGFTPNDLGTLTVRSYTGPNDTCNLQFGTLAADRLPGDDIKALVAPQLTALKEAGATVTGPDDGEALVLKDVRDPAVTYTLPTVKISFVQGNKQGLSYYSAGILKGGERVFVSRSCVNPNGAIDQSAFKVVDEKSKQITLTKQ